jgi:UDPglucose--hexose-1-phosphate uridylyltransferase
MGQIRKDFLIERYSIISETRSKRPKHFECAFEEKTGQVCFFCPGNESMTPPTITQSPARGPWKIRVFRNKFPALQSPRGDHEVVVDTEKHGVSLEDMKPEEIVDVFKMYEKRRTTLEKRYRYVSIFKNYGKGSGASLAHAHTQILASNMVPPIPAAEAAAAKKHYDKWHRCAWCDKIAKADKKRIAFETKRTIAVTPNAPRFGYEVWIMPKRHVGNFSDLKPDEMLDFCTMLKKTLVKLTKELGCSPYNFVLHHARKGEKFVHFHVEIMPRTATHAGYELGEGTYIVDVSPETAAKFFRFKGPLKAD